MQQEGQDDANIQLKQLLEQTLKPSECLLAAAAAACDADDAGVRQLHQSALGQAMKPLLYWTAGGNDPVTAQSDLWAHARITPTLRNAALTLQASDVYKKVKPPGDTTLYKCVPSVG